MKAFAFLLILIGAARIVSTYRVFSQQWDEPAHIASGLEWWQNGTYGYGGTEHPPLSRIFVAAPLYFRGVRLARFEDGDLDGNAALTAGGRYAGNLAWARAGNLPFWILSCVLLFVLTRQMYGDATALLALLLYSTLPPVLGIAGWAYTDTALVAGILFFAWRWVAFVGKPGLRNAFWLGLSIAFALLSKYSSIPYMVETVAFSAVVLIGGHRITAPRGVAAVVRAGALLLCIAFTTLFFTWACFRFTLPVRQPISDIAGQAHPLVDQRFGTSGFRHRVAYWVLDTPLPVPEMIRGVMRNTAHAADGHRAYNFGKVRTHGTFYYFPVLLVLTVPLALVVMLIPGVFSLSRVPKDADISFRQSILLTVPLAVLFVNAFSAVNIGYRHNLAFYPFVCLVGAAGCVFLWSRGRRWLRLLVVLLVGQYLVSSALAHPNYASYFNLLAGREPEEICVSSQGGGDEWRLASRLRELGATHVCLALGPILPLDALGLPPATVLHDDTPCEGWVAVDAYRYHLGWTNPDRSHTGLDWLRSYQPAERIGTLRLYRIPYASHR